MLFPEALTSMRSFNQYNSYSILDPSAFPRLPGKLAQYLLYSFPVRVASLLRDVPQHQRGYGGVYGRS